MRAAIVILGAVGTIEIAAVCDIKAALQRFAIEKTLTRLQNVIAGKFAADFVEKFHTIMKEHAVYDNLPAKQSRWEISLHNARDLSWTREPASHKSSVGKPGRYRQDPQLFQVNVVSIERPT